jgi:hypothetical protein
VKKLPKHPKMRFSRGSGVPMMSAPSAAPPMISTSDGWFNASRSPPCIR